MAPIAMILLLFVTIMCFREGYSFTNPQDVAALRSVMSQWNNTPPSWKQSDDPCSTPWEGVVCNNNFSVTALKLSTMGLVGTLSSDIGQLTQLQSLDLSYNPDLGGPLTPNIGNLKQLSVLILAGCRFSSNIPQELGSLPQLSFLALNSNQFSGEIPASIGLLSNLFWLDLAGNQLTGTLPISTRNSPGLDLLVNTKHFHFNKNQLSGNIPARLFSSEMKLIHLLLNGNRLTGTIPASVGLVQSLELLRLDANFLSGPVPSNIKNLTNINELNLANNHFTGSMPDLTGMNNLNYLDLSNNTFDATEAPTWFSTIKSLSVLQIESGGLRGPIPQNMFSLPQLQQVLLSNNAFNGTLNMGSSISSQLQIVDFQNNAISSLTLSSSFNKTLILYGNPVCDHQLSGTVYCQSH